MDDNSECGTCKHCIGGECLYIGDGEWCDPADCCNGEICCDPDESCCTDSGVDDPYCCPDSETCCDGECYNTTTQKCCPGGSSDDFKCDSDETCCEGNCCSPNDCCVDGQCINNGEECGTDQTCCEGSCCALPKCCIGGNCTTPSWLPNGSVSVSADPTVVNAVNSALNNIPGVNVSLTGLSFSASCNLKKCCEPAGTLGNQTCADGTLTISTTIGKTTVWGSPPIAVSLGTENWGVSFTAFAGVWVEGELSASGTAGNFTDDCGTGCVYGSGSISATGSVSAGGYGCCCVITFGEPHCGEAEVSGTASISFTGTVRNNQCGNCDGVNGSIELGDIVFTGTATMGGLSASLGPYVIYDNPNS